MSIDAASHYEINGPDVVAEKFDEDVVILNLADGRYFGLAGIANSIWPLLLQGHTPAAILSSIRAERPELSEKSAEFLRRLVDLNLVRPTVGAADVAATPLTVVWSGGDPAVEIFDDLAELIFADPIHDIDEQAGWPVPRPSQ